MDQATAVRFQNITFEECRSGAVTIKRGEHVAFDHCNFARIGGTEDHTELGIMVGGGRNNIVTSNIFSNCKEDVSADARSVGWAKSKFGPTLIQRLEAIPTDQEPWKSRYPQVGHTLSDKPYSPLGTKITGNAFVACGKSWMHHENGGGAAVLEPNFEKLPTKALIQNGRKVTIDGTDVRFEKPETSPRGNSQK